jgi:hypothetical protein
MTAIPHDHVLLFTGVNFGIAMFELECTHGNDPKFYVDDEEREYDDCLISEWFDNDGLDIIGNSDHVTPNGLLLWTTHHYGGEPVLTGLAEYMEWKEGIEN